MAAIPGCDNLVLGAGPVGRLVRAALPKGENNVVMDARSAFEARLVGPQFLWEDIPGVRTEPFLVHTRVDGAVPEMEAITKYKRKVKKDRDIEWPARMWGQFDPLRQAFKVVRWPEHMILWEREVVELRAREKCVVMRNGEKRTYKHLLSTIPLPTLLDMLGEEDAAEIGWTGEDEPPCAPIWFQKGPYYGPPIPVQVKEQDMYMNYLSGDGPCYRMTSYGGTWFAEGLKQPEADEFWLGSVQNNPETFCVFPGKIYDAPGTDQGKRWEGLDARDALEEYGVWCFGRFGAWHGDELLHESWKRASEWVKKVKR